MKGWMYMFLNVFANIVFILQFLVVGYYFFSFPTRPTRCSQYKYRILFFLGITFFVSYVLDSFIANLFLKLFIGILYIHWVLCRIYSTSRRTLFGYCCIMYVVFDLLNQMGYILVKSVIHLINYSISDTLLQIIAHSIITILLYVIGKLSKNKIRDRLQFIEKKYIVLFFFILIVDSAIVSILGEFVLDIYISKNQFGFTVAYILVVIGIFIQLFLVVALILSRNTYREKEALAKQYLNDQKQHYEYLKFQERETRKFRHDLKDHMYLLSTMYAQGNLENFNTYIEEMNVKITSFGNKISVNNEIADAIFNKFYYEGKEQGILLNVQGHFPMECNISAYDLCTILSNLLSNAMRAQIECGGGQIHVSIRYTDTEITIIIENHYLQEPLQTKGIFQTRKTDKENHGFGLENVSECVEKNRGQIMIETENNRFKVMLCLHNEPHKVTTERIECHENSNHR